MMTLSGPSNLVEECRAAHKGNWKSHTPRIGMACEVAVLMRGRNTLIVERRGSEYRSRLFCGSIGTAGELAASAAGALGCWNLDPLARIEMQSDRPEFIRRLGSRPVRSSMALEFFVIVLAVALVVGLAILANGGVNGP